MADILTHSFTSTKPDSLDPSVISATDWNDGHKFIGGTNGQLLVADSTQLKGVKWVDGVVTLNNAVSVSGASPFTNNSIITFTCTSNVIVYVTYTFQNITLSPGVGYNPTVTLDSTGVYGIGFVGSNDVVSRVLSTTVNAGTHNLGAVLTLAGSTFSSGYIIIGGIYIGVA